MLIKSKIIIILFCLTLSAYGCIFTGNIFRRGYTEKECQQINANFNQLKIGMTKTEVIKLIGEESSYIIYPNPGYLKIFSEQKTQWEIWLLCQKSSYQWQMIAFDIKIQKLIKVFFNEPDTIGF